jgi:very-long-chain (3R)-3-hydroxyacyl-CoA dehydratase
LFFYNALSAAGWAYVLYLLVQGLVVSYLQKGKLDYNSLTLAAFEKSASYALWVQTYAVLEVLHALVGLVKTPVTSTIMQVSSRLFLVWGVIYLYGHSAVVKTNPAYVTMIFAWCITEIVRYSYYVASIANGTVPYFLVWLRYSLFYVLYPLGASSEVLMAYGALNLVKAYSINVYYLYLAILLSYPPGIT